MVMLVTLEQASQHLRRDTDDDDSDLTLKIHAASAAVMNYVKNAEIFSNTAFVLNGFDSVLFGEDNVIFTSDQPVAVPYEIKAATLIMLGILYRDRDGQEMTDWDLGYLPKPVMALLYPLRDPAMGVSIA